MLRRGLEECGLPADPSNCVTCGRIRSFWWSVRPVTGREVSHADEREVRANRRPRVGQASSRNAGRLTTDVRVLLDANLPRTFAALLPGHRVDTVHQRHWSDLNDRSLLDSAEREYDAFLRRPRIDLPRVPRLA